ncbi:MULTISPECIES: hypothetical protein [unclassified Pseudomonas]|uniref:hypothetical protein n=1 Tax=unclassified Pseudomonas TaxID=196821 RepID=UPI0004B0EE25|nr:MULTISPECIES: hypothetical protein [unclassified Pseudomonas]
MGKRKLFIKTDLGTPQIEYKLDTGGNVSILPDAVPPKNTLVRFERNNSHARNFDFSKWYNIKIDAITYVCQRQIERLLDGQDGRMALSTIASYCTIGIRGFLDYCALYATAIERNLSLTDLNRSLIDGFIKYLSERDMTKSCQYTYYSQTKSILTFIGQRGIFPLIHSGDTATFPRNPFPNKKTIGETALSKRERQELSAALRQAIKPIWVDDSPATSKILAYALTLIALHTGRNTTPLLEMDRDCLHSHPKDDIVFLVLWKRRGYNHSKVALRPQSGTEDAHELMSSVKINIERLIRRVMVVTEPLESEAPDDLKGRVWLYRSRQRGTKLGQVTVLTDIVLGRAISGLVDDYGLMDIDGKPLRVNLSRLRKTFGNRIWELTNGDIITTSAALGNTPHVTDQNYLAPGENATKNWQFMGEILVKELLSASIGATYKTPLGKCSDPVNGQYAPKQRGETCTNFMNCLRCKHYAVTGEDLYKLFSFYFRVLAERSRMDKRRWAREYAHIPRLIDHYIVAEGLRRKAFKPKAIEIARERARTQPHPFWSFDIVESLEVFS